MRNKKLELYKNLYRSFYFDELQKILTKIDFNNEGDYYYLHEQFVHADYRNRGVYGYENPNLDKKYLSIAIDCFFNLFDKEGNEPFAEQLISILSCCLSDIANDADFTKCRLYGESFLAKILKHFGISVTFNFENLGSSNENDTFDTLIARLKNKIESAANGNVKLKVYENFPNILYVTKELRNKEAHVIKELVPAEKWNRTLRLLIHSYVATFYVLNVICNKHTESGEQDVKIFSGKFKLSIKEVDGAELIRETIDKQERTVSLKNYHAYEFSQILVLGNSKTMSLKQPLCWDCPNVEITIKNGECRVYANTKLAEYVQLYIKDKFNIQVQLDNLNAKIDALDESIRQATAISEPQREQDDSLKSLLLATINKVVEIKTQNTEIDEHIASIEGQLGEIASLLNSVKQGDDLKSIVVEGIRSLALPEEIAEAIIGQLEGKLDAIAKDAVETRRNTEALLEESKQHGKKLNDLLSDKQQKKERKEKFRKYASRWGLVAVVIILIALPVFLIPTEYFYEKTHSDYYAQLLYNDGSHDIAHRHAQLLEKQGDYEAATEWYQKARSRYASIVDSDTTETEYAYQLALLYVHLKGGTDQCIDNTMATARKYARIAGHGPRGRGLEVYLDWLISDNPVATRTLINQMEDYDTSDYLLLTKASMQLGEVELLTDDQQNSDLYLQAYRTIDSLDLYSPEVRFDSHWILCDCALSGIHCGSKAIIAPDLYLAYCNLWQASMIENNALAQIIFASLSLDLHDYEQATTILDRLWKNGVRDISAYYYIQLIDYNLAEAPPYDADMRAYISNLSNNPIGTLHTAETNQRKGYLGDDYYLNKLKEIDAYEKRSNFFQTREVFDRQWTIHILTHKVHSIEDTYQLLDPTLPDSIKRAMGEYLLGIKYAEGYGVDKNITLSDSLIREAAIKNLTEARYTWGCRLLEEGYMLEGIACLEEIVDSIIYAPLTLMTISNLDYLDARYLKKLDNSPEAILYRPLYEGPQGAIPIASDTTTEEMSQLSKYIQDVEKALSVNMAHIFEHPEVCSRYLYDMMLYHNCLNADTSRVNFYANLISRMGIPYYNSLVLFEMGYNKYFSNPTESKKFFEEFCKLYFLPGNQTLCDWVKEDVLDVLSLMCPEVAGKYIPAVLDIYQRGESLRNAIREGAPIPDVMWSHFININLPTYIY